MEERKPAKLKVEAAPKPRPPAAAKKKLSYLDQIEHQTMEQRIADAESNLEAKRAALQDPTVVVDGRRLEEAYKDMEAAQSNVDALYARWAELEEKLG